MFDCTKWWNTIFVRTHNQLYNNKIKSQLGVIFGSILVYDFTFSWPIRRNETPVSVKHLRQVILLVVDTIHYNVFILHEDWLNRWGDCRGFPHKFPATDDTSNNLIFHWISYNEQSHHEYQLPPNVIGVSVTSSNRHHGYFSANINHTSWITNNPSLVKMIVPSDKLVRSAFGASPA